jgi:hypothetical protein
MDHTARSRKRDVGPFELGGYFNSAHVGHIIRVKCRKSISTG